MRSQVLDRARITALPAAILQGEVSLERTTAGLGERHARMEVEHATQGVSDDARVRARSTRPAEQITALGAAGDGATTPTIPRPKAPASGAGDWRRFMSKARRGPARALPHGSRRIRMVQPKEHETYRLRSKPKEILRCEECGVFAHAGK